MEILKCKLKDIFEMLHDEKNTRFYNNLVLMTRDEDRYPCALSDEEVRYGTDNYALFEQAVKTDFPAHIAEQILNYEISINLGISTITALDTAIHYYEDTEKTEKEKLLYLTAYPKYEFEETKMFKSGKCGGFLF